MTTPVKNLLENRILVVDDIMTPTECYRLIERAETKGFKNSAKSGGGHGQHPKTGARTSQFCVIDDFEVAQTLWNRAASREGAIPHDLDSIKPVPYISKGYVPVSVNEHLRIYKYDPGQCIPCHDDYRVSRYRKRASGEIVKQMSFYTYLVYLNDNFEEGETVYYPKFGTGEEKGHCRYKKDVKLARTDITVTPKTGMVLISDHVIQHEGRSPKKGTKYVVRTDIMHEKIATYVPDKLTFNSDGFSEWERHYEPSCLHYTE